MKTEAGTVLLTESVPGVGHGRHQAPRSNPRSTPRSSPPTPQSPEHEDTELSSPDRLEHLPSTCRTPMEHLLRGHLLDPPHLPTRTVKLYVLSAGSDSVQERTALAKTVYPKLKTLCAQAYGCEFQAVDLRWGVEDSGMCSDPHRSKLLLQYIAECQAMSLGPNIAMIVGDKYGPVEVPSELPLEEYEAIRRYIKEPADLEFLSKWYKKNTNTVPPIYALQQCSKEDAQVWESLHGRLLNLLVCGARHAVHQEHLSVDVLNSLTTAVLEHEVQVAIAGQGSSANCCSNTLAVFRSITDLPRYLDRAPMAEFLDLEPNTITPDAEKSTKLKEMVEGEIVANTRVDNVIRAGVKYHDPDGMNAKAHAGYLEDMCTKLYNAARRTIEEHVGKLDAKIPDDALCVEALQHWSLVGERCEEFTGRERELDEIAMYIMDETDRALVVCGNHGDGKTSLLAKAAQGIQESPLIKAQVVVRFCSLTSDSSYLREMLYSLVHQLAIVTGHHRREIPRSHKGIIKYFRNLLMAGNFPGMLVIFLDGLDQLSPRDHANKLEWLPSKIANNVKLIISTVPKDNGIYDKLCSKITDEKYHLQIGPLPASQCGTMVTDWLNSNGRILNFYQWRNLKAAFTKCSSPLYVKIAFDEAMLWPSYIKDQESILPTSIEATLNAIFERLEEKHGKLFFSHCAAYITASKHGVSHTELEDLLSLDDEVLNSIFTTWQPSIRRLPSIYWAQVFNDITVFLQQSQVDNTSLFSWAQQQILMVAQKRYLTDPAIKKKIHGNFSDYFLGTYGGTRKKPFAYEKPLMKKMHIKEQNSAEVRHVPEQPLIFTTFTSTERFNLRKLNQMPYHLIKAGRKEQANEEVFFNFQWLYTKLRACSTHAVLTDYSLCSDQDQDVRLVAEALEDCEATLVEDPKLASLEIPGRLLPHAATFPNIKQLISQCDLAAMVTCPIVPQWQTFQCPGAPMSFSCQNPNGGELKLIHTDSSVLLSSKAEDQSTVIWDIQRNTQLTGLDVVPGSSIYPTPNGEYVHCIQENQALVTFKLDSGELYGEVPFPVGNINSMAVGNKYTAFTFEQSHGPMLIDTEASVLVNRFQYRSNMVAISQDQDFMVCNNGLTINVHEIPLMERRCTVEVTSLPTKILFTPNPQEFLVAFQNKQLVCVYANYGLKTASVSAILHEIEMQDVVLSNTGKKILVRASRSLYVFDLEKRQIGSHIKSMPPGVFVEKLSTFLGAGFSADDSMIVAIRHTYLAVWDAETYEPLRVFQTSVFPVSRLLTASSIANKVVTLDGANIYVWNLDNVETEAQYQTKVVSGAIVHVAHATNGMKTICCGGTHAEARVYNALTSDCEHTLVHAFEGTLSDVCISPTGRFAVTSVPDTELQPHTKPWVALHEVKLWLVDSARMLRCLFSNRMVTFTPTDDKVVFFPCRYYDTTSWEKSEFNMNIINFGSDEEYVIELPTGDFVGEAVITTTGEFLAVILQLQPPETNPQQGPKIRLLLYSFEKYWNGIKYLKPQTIWTGLNEKDNFLDVRQLNGDQVLITYGKDFEMFAHSESGVLDRSVPVPKGALVYDIRKDCVIHRYDPWLSPESDVSLTQGSRNHAVFIDQHLQVFNGASGAQISTIADINCREGSGRLLLDGQFLATINRNSREIHVYRTSDGVRQARFFVHGEASHLELGHHDSVFMVACRDGRILMFSCVLGQADHMKAIVRKLPSRNLTHCDPETNGITTMNGMSRDLNQRDLNQHTQNTQTTPNNTFQRRNLSLHNSQTSLTNTTTQGIATRPHTSPNNNGPALATRPHTSPNNTGPALATSLTSQTTPFSNGPAPTRPHSAALARDVCGIRRTLNEHRALSAVTRHRHGDRRPPAYQALSEGAMLSREIAHNSQACCIQ